METIEVTATIPATARQIYKDWLSDSGHSQMTGGVASAKSEVDSPYSAWDGYISGKQLALEPHQYIRQSWRSTEFGEHDLDSILEIFLSDTPSGCELRLVHSNIPKGQGAAYKSGWVEHYFEPMTRYYQST